MGGWWRLRLGSVRGGGWALGGICCNWGFLLGEVDGMLGGRADVFGCVEFIDCI